MIVKLNGKIIQPKEKMLFFEDDLFALPIDLDPLTLQFITTEDYSEPRVRLRPISIQRAHYGPYRRSVDRRSASQYGS